MGGGEDASSRGDTLIGQAVVDVVRGQQADAAMPVLAVVPVEEGAAVSAAVLRGSEALGKSGRYLSVLNWASENGLSLETCGLEWVFVTPRSASSCATSLERIELPRSAWIVSWPGLMP